MATAEAELVVRLEMKGLGKVESACRLADLKTGPAAKE
jgi:hypothetical protein